MIIKKLQQLKAKKGFTLVELLVVIAIIGILAAVLIPLMATFLNNARISNADSAAKQAKSIVDGWLQAEANSRNRGLTGTTAVPVYATFVLTTAGSATGAATWTSLAGGVESTNAYRVGATGQATTMAALAAEFSEGFAGQSRPAAFLIVMQGPNNLCIGVAFMEYGGTTAPVLADVAHFIEPLATMTTVNGGIRRVASGRHASTGTDAPPTATLNRIVGTYPAR